MEPSSVKSTPSSRNFECSSRVIRATFASRLQRRHMAMMGFEHFVGMAWSAHCVQQTNEACRLPESIVLMLGPNMGFGRLAVILDCPRGAQAQTAGLELNIIPWSHACWLVCETPPIRHLSLNCSGWHASANTWLSPSGGATAVLLVVSSSVPTSAVCQSCLTCRMTTNRRPSTSTHWNTLHRCSPLIR